MKTTAAFAALCCLSIAGAAPSSGPDRPAATVQAATAPVQAEKVSADQPAESPPLPVIPFAIGARSFAPGDSISLRQVRATSPELRPGDRLSVRGECTLHSRPAATLYLGVTATSGEGRVGVLAQQRRDIRRGPTEFELSITIPGEGCPHVSFYSADGKPLGKIYFGTPQQADRSKNWDVRRWCEGH